MFDRRLLKDFDWLTLLLALVLSGLGVVGVYSATRDVAGLSPIFVDHVVRLALGLAVLLFVIVLDYRHLVSYAYLIFVAAVLLLLAVAFHGSVGMGAQRWLAFGGFRLQPSEFLKVAMVLMLARYFGAMKKKPPLSLKDVLPTALAVGLPVLLVLRQPDLGTALVVVGIYVIMLFVVGLNFRIYLWTGGGVMLAAGIFSALAYFRIFNILNLLREYQVRRLPSMVANSESAPDHDRSYTVDTGRRSGARRAAWVEHSAAHRSLRAHHAARLPRRGHERYGRVRVLREKASGESEVLARSRIRRGKVCP